MCVVASLCLSFVRRIACRDQVLILSFFSEVVTLYQLQNIFVKFFVNVFYYSTQKTLTFLRNWYIFYTFPKIKSSLFGSLPCNAWWCLWLKIAHCLLRGFRCHDIFGGLNWVFQWASTKVYKCSHPTFPFFCFNWFKIEILAFWLIIFYWTSFS